MPALPLGCSGYRAWRNPQGMHTYEGSPSSARTARTLPSADSWQASAAITGSWLLTSARRARSKPSVIENTASLPQMRSISLRRSHAMHKRARYSVYQAHRTTQPISDALIGAKHAIHPPGRASPPHPAPARPGCGLYPAWSLGSRPAPGSWSSCSPSRSPCRRAAR